MMELKVFNNTISAYGGRWETRLELPVETEILIPDYLPAVFTRGRLEEVMRYLLGGSRGKVFVKEDGVYDSRCRKLRRACLIGSDPRLDTLREIVLSGAGKVECLAPPCAAEENFLRRYYAGRVGFSS